MVRQTEGEHEKTPDLSEEPLSFSTCDQEAIKNACLKALRDHGIRSPFMAAVVQYFHKLEINFI